MQKRRLKVPPLGQMRYMAHLKYAGLFNVNVRAQKQQLVGESNLYLSVATPIIGHNHLIKTLTSLKALVESSTPIDHGHINQVCHSKLI